MCINIGFNSSKGPLEGISPGTPRKGGIKGPGLGWRWSSRKDIDLPSYYRWHKMLPTQDNQDERRPPSPPQDLGVSYIPLPVPALTDRLNTPGSPPVQDQTYPRQPHFTPPPFPYQPLSPTGLPTTPLSSCTNISTTWAQTEQGSLSLFTDTQTQTHHITLTTTTQWNLERTVE